MYSTLCVSGPGGAFACLGPILPGQEDAGTELLMGRKALRQCLSLKWRAPGVQTDRRHQGSSPSHEQRRIISQRNGSKDKS